MPNLQRAAPVKARGGRVAMDRYRQARDNRVERAAARVFLGVEQRGCAEQAARDASSGSAGRRELLTEQIGLQDVAELCDLNCLRSGG